MTTWNNYISTTALATKLGRLVTCHKGLLPMFWSFWSHPILWSHGLARSYDKLKPLFIHFCNIYGCKMWQDGDLPRLTLWLYRQKPIKASYHPTKFAGHKHCGSGDIMILVITYNLTRPHDQRVMWLKVRVHQGRLPSCQNWWP